MEDIQWSGGICDIVSVTVLVSDLMTLKKLAWPDTNGASFAKTTLKHH
jgi:hypothetical protein